jgi:hypothetical protein
LRCGRDTEWGLVPGGHVGRYLAQDPETKIFQKIGSRNYSACRYQEDRPLIGRFSGVGQLALKPPRTAFKPIEGFHANPANNHRYSFHSRHNDRDHHGRGRVVRFESWHCRLVVRDWWRVR